MTWAACAAARDVDPLIAFCRKTEGDRPARTGDDGHPRRDLHAELRALDFTFEYDNNVRIDPQLYTEIAFNMRMRLGDDYDVLQHAVGTDALHIHCELDPK